MNDQIQTLKDDIAFMRAMAEEGRSAPLLGGAVLTSAGVVYALASLAQWAVLTQTVAVSYKVLPYMWLAAMLISMTLLAVFKRRLAGAPGSASPANRAARFAWKGVGQAIFAIGAAMFIAVWKTQDYNLINFSPSIVLALYGVAWTVGGLMIPASWVRFVAWGAFAAAVLMALLIGDVKVWLAYAAALLLLTAVPGVVLMRQAPSDVI